MGLRRNALLLLLLTALIAIVGDWSGNALASRLWCAPAGLLLLGLAYEALGIARAALDYQLRSPARWYLGRAMPVEFEISHQLRRTLIVELAPAAAAEVSMDRSLRRLPVHADQPAVHRLSATARRLGRYQWPPARARVGGLLGLGWWPRTLKAGESFQVMPDVVHEPAAARGMHERGRQSARQAGAGSDVLQLREYQPGDPQRSIDWKASARAGRLISRVFAETQQLDIVIAVDTGRASGLSAGDTDRLALYANVAARLAQRAVSCDDRVGLLTYAEKPLAAMPPGQGAAAVMRARALLSGMSVGRMDSNHALAAIRIRSLVRHRSLVVMLTDLDDATLAGDLRSAVRLLLPTHLPFIAGVASERIAALGRCRASDELQAYQALAAQEYGNATARQAAALRALGAPTVLASADELDRVVIEAYLHFRRRRRI